ncbi:hypothetical protein EJ02DRAFT_431889 [Clathrospora elynae]|uniref:Extracellular membrane protein CFEM domain-containing protein n=1 Tax=Clathrospora elynae TaxID=706981 RepID=A0A6A5SX29_9PLEO|nr:hypothetical protein EJ02DRAFT_431889 [Clathrospora elynae]
MHLTASVLTGLITVSATSAAGLTTKLAPSKAAAGATPARSTTVDGNWHIGCTNDNHCTYYQGIQVSPASAATTWVGIPAAPGPVEPVSFIPSTCGLCTDYTTCSRCEFDWSMHGWEHWQCTDIVMDHQLCIDLPPQLAASIRNSTATPAPGVKFPLAPCFTTTTTMSTTKKTTKSTTTTETESTTKKTTKSTTTTETKSTTLTVSPLWTTIVVTYTTTYVFPTGKKTTTKTTIATRTTTAFVTTSALTCSYSGITSWTVPTWYTTIATYWPTGPASRRDWTKVITCVSDGMPYIITAISPHSLPTRTKTFFALSTGTAAPLPRRNAVKGTFSALTNATSMATNRCDDYEACLKACPDLTCMVACIESYEECYDTAITNATAIAKNGCAENCDCGSSLHEKIAGNSSATVIQDIKASLKRIAKDLQKCYDDNQPLFMDVYSDMHKLEKLLRGNSSSDADTVSIINTIIEDFEDLGLAIVDCYEKDAPDVKDLFSNIFKLLPNETTTSTVNVHAPHGTAPSLSHRTISGDNVTCREVTSSNPGVNCHAYQFPCVDCYHYECFNELRQTTQCYDIRPEVADCICNKIMDVHTATRALTTTAESIAIPVYTKTTNSTRPLKIATEAVAIPVTIVPTICTMSGSSQTRVAAPLSHRNTAFTSSTCILCGEDPKCEVCDFYCDSCDHFLCVDLTTGLGTCIETEHERRASKINTTAKGSDKSLGHAVTLLHFNGRENRDIAPVANAMPPHFNFSDSDCIDCTVNPNACNECVWQFTCGQKQKCLHDGAREVVELCCETGESCNA